ncbi:hypothetical protein TNCV_1437121 [Trichonephila clavipes]|nr:hypothetical protein TNCV_1437121 [Trichonephila clavipes]
MVGELRTPSDPLGPSMVPNTEKNHHNEMSLTNTNQELVPTLHSNALFRCRRKGIYHCCSICNYTLLLSHLSSVRRIMEKASAGIQQ